MRCVWGFNGKKYMKLSKRVNLSVLVLGVSGLAVGGGAGAAITNDGYPPLGGVSLSSSGTGVGNGGGRTWSFSAFDFSAFDQLWYGIDTTYLPMIAMNQQAGFTAGENLVYSVADSSPGSGIAVWTGNSDFTYNVPSAVTVNVPVRLTLTLGGAGASEFVESTTLLAIDPAFDTSQSVVAEVSGDFSINILAEAFKDGSWTPINDLFDAESTYESDGTRSSFGTTFYSTAVPEPMSAMLLALGGVALQLRRRRCSADG